MSPSRSAIRTLRCAEWLYAIVALALWSGLPVRPQGSQWLLWAHWLGTALIAAWLGWRVGRPTRAVLVVAAALSCLVFAQAVSSLWRWRLLLAALPTMFFFSLAVVSFAWLCQLVVAIVLWLNRSALRARGSSAMKSPPLVSR